MTGHQYDLFLNLGLLFHNAKNSIYLFGIVLLVDIFT